MSRQKAINMAVGAVIGYASGVLIHSGNAILGIAIILAWLIGMVNSLIPSE